MYRLLVQCISYLQQIVGKKKKYLEDYNTVERKSMY